jgi:hypothetical protein
VKSWPAARAQCGPILGSEPGEQPLEVAFPFVKIAQSTANGAHAPVCADQPALFTPLIRLIVHASGQRESGLVLTPGRQIFCFRREHLEHGPTLRVSGPSLLCPCQRVLEPGAARPIEVALGSQPRDLQQPLELRALGGRRRVREHGQAAVELAESLAKGRQPHGLAAGVMQRASGLQVQARSLIVPRQLRGQGQGSLPHGLARG